MTQITPNGRVLPDLSATKLPSQAELLQMLQAAQQKITDLESRPARKVWFKVTEKGGCSAYGMGQFPVTLYRSQWEQLIASIPDLEAFLKSNAPKLTSKPTKG